jgi:hypothetical protein
MERERQRERERILLESDPNIAIDAFCVTMMRHTRYFRWKTDDENIILVRSITYLTE